MKFKGLSIAIVTSTLILSLTLLALGRNEQPPQGRIEIEYINPPTLGDGIPFGFSQATRYTTPAGITSVFVSGQTAFDPEGNLVGGDDFEGQAEQAFLNLRLALDAAGATPSDVVRLEIFVVDYTPDLFPIIARLETEFTDPPTAASLVGVSALAVPGLRIEVQATAVFDAFR